MNTTTLRDVAARVVRNIDHVDERFGDYRIEVDHSLFYGRRLRVYDEDDNEVFRYRL